jgi:hypothetical protein
MGNRWKIAQTVVASLAAVAVAACGGGARASHRSVAVQVAGVSIDGATVNRWAKAMALSAQGGALVDGNGSPRQRAVQFLVMAHWLIGEARDRGRAISRAAVERRVRERVDAFPHGKPEYERELSAGYQTSGDAELEIEAEVAGGIVRSFMPSKAVRATRAEIVDYYRSHPSQFRAPRLRIADLIEGLPSREAAILLGKRLGPGARFAHRAAHESVAPETPAEAARIGNGELVHGIYAAPIGRVAGPVRYADHWVLIVVRKTVPAGPVPLAQVQAKIGKRLSSERYSRARRDFLEAYRRKWIARTSCSAGFVVWGCSQYKGSSLEVANPLTLY